MRYPPLPTQQQPTLVSPGISRTLDTFHAFAHTTPSTWNAFSCSASASAYSLLKTGLRSLLLETFPGLPIWCPGVRVLYIQLCHRPPTPLLLSPTSLQQPCVLPSDLSPPLDWDPPEEGTAWVHPLCSMPHALGLTHKCSASDFLNESGGLISFDLE